MHETRVLVVDPDEDDRRATERTIRAGPADVTIHPATSHADAKAVLAEEPPDVVVTRYDLGDGTGLDLAEHVRATVPDAGCLLYADRTDLDTENFEETIVEVVPREMTNAEGLLAELVEELGPRKRQAGYPLPDDETARLEAVERYVEGAEAVAGPLERITDLAAQQFDVPVASVNVIDRHTQTVLATNGPAWPPDQREDSIGTHALVHDQPTMAVEDVEDDPRFAENETLAAADIAGYLGAKLVTPEGHVLGALCVYDDGPRPFSPDERASLETLARLVVDVLVLGADGESAATGGEGA